MREREDRQRRYSIHRRPQDGRFSPPANAALHNRELGTRGSRSADVTGRARGCEKRTRERKTCCRWTEGKGRGGHAPRDRHSRNYTEKRGFPEEKKDSYHARQIQKPCLRLLYGRAVGERVKKQKRALDAESPGQGIQNIRGMLLKPCSRGKSVHQGFAGT